MNNQHFPILFPWFSSQIPGNLPIFTWLGPGPIFLGRLFAGDDQRGSLQLRWSALRLLHEVTKPQELMESLTAEVFDFWRRLIYSIIEVFDIWFLRCLIICLISIFSTDIFSMNAHNLRTDPPFWLGKLYLEIAIEMMEHDGKEP